MRNRQQPRRQVEALSPALAAHLVDEGDPGAAAVDPRHASRFKNPWPASGGERNSSNNAIK